MGACCSTATEKVTLIAPADQGPLFPLYSAEDGFYIIVKRDIARLSSLNAADLASYNQGMPLYFWAMVVAFSTQHPRVQKIYTSLGVQHKELYLEVTPPGTYGFCDFEPNLHINIHPRPPSLEGLKKVAVRKKGTEVLNLGGMTVLEVLRKLQTAFSAFPGQPFAGRLKKLLKTLEK